MGISSFIDAIQSASTYFPGRDISATPQTFGLAYEDLLLKTGDGETISAWYFSGHLQKTIVFLHGNGGNLSGWATFFADLSKLGANLLFIDYRGYGKSSGKPNEFGLYRDARAAYDEVVKNRGIAPQDIILFGSSLGAAVAMKLATQVPIGKLIIEAPFTDTKDMARFHYPYLPLRFFMIKRFDNVSRARAITVPTLWIHGEQDNIVPIAMGQKVFDALGVSKIKYVVPNAGHNDLYAQDSKQYLSVIEQFIVQPSADR